MPANAPYEYKVVPAPRAVRRIKGARGPQERFARTLEEILAEEAVDGWEFLRAEHLEIDEKRSWLSRARPTHRSVLVFRRGAAAAPAWTAPQPGQMAHPGRAPAPSAAPPAPPAAGGMMDPDLAWARAQAPEPAPAPTAPPVRAEDPALRLAPAGQPASLRPDPDVHPDPAAPRIGPAER